MKKIVLSLSFFGVLSTAMFAQEKNNNVKLGLLGLPFKNIRLSYERVLTERMSVQVSGAFLLRRELPDQFMDSGTSMDETGTGQNNTDAITSSSFGGYNIMPELRIYTKKHDGAPVGFYFGPYLKYNNYSVKMSGVYGSVVADATGGFNSFGGGLNIGCQWSIKDVVTIDWNILSLGVNMGQVSMAMKTNDSSIDYDAWADSYNNSSSNQSGGYTLAASATSNGITVKSSRMPGLGIGMRLGIGIRF